MGLDITLNTTDYTVKRGTTTIGNIKKLADGSVVFVSGIQITYTAAEMDQTAAEMDQITAFMKTL